MDQTGFCPLVKKFPQFSEWSHDGNLTNQMSHIKGPFLHMGTD
jgi:hypothetical protein